MLTQRVVEMLWAFTETIVVVVAVDRAVTPTLFTVHAPTRRLHETRRPIVGWPRAQLLIDLLLPSSDADRQIQVNLPDGVSFDNSRTTTPRGGMAIAVRRPRPLEHLYSLMTELTEHSERRPRPGPVLRCIADMATAKSDAAVEALRHHLVGSNGDPDTHLQATWNTRDKLAKLRFELDELSADHSSSIKLQRLWHGGDWIPKTMYRPTMVDTLSPRAAVARAAAIEDVTQRATPVYARIQVNVARLQPAHL